MRNLEYLKAYIVNNPMHEKMNAVLSSILELIPKEHRQEVKLPVTYRLPYNDRIDMWILVSSDFGWEHVSVSLLTKCSEPCLIERCPKWEEMQFVKDKFFKEDECVVQFHPAKEDYVNNHPYVLHLWRPVDGTFPRPPKGLV